MADLFWLSFCNPRLPEGQRFLGACVVAGSDLPAAVAEATKRGINPGGEVLGVEVEAGSAPLIPEMWKNRLLNHEECGRFDAVMLPLQDAAGVAVPHDPPESFICADHNKP